MTTPATKINGTSQAAPRGKPLHHPREQLARRMLTNEHQRQQGPEPELHPQQMQAEQWHQQPARRTFRAVSDGREGKGDEHGASHAKRAHSGPIPLDGPCAAAPVPPGAWPPPARRATAARSPANAGSKTPDIAPAMLAASSRYSPISNAAPASAATRISRSMPRRRHRPAPRRRQENSTAPPACRIGHEAQRAQCRRQQIRQHGRSLRDRSFSAWAGRPRSLAPQGPP